MAGVKPYDLTDSILDDILAKEGDRYTNIVGDAGGPTKYGITQATLAEYRGLPVSPLDVQQLGIDEAKAIYTKSYLAPFAEFHGYETLYRLLVDSAVQHGVERVKEWLAEIISTDPEVVRRKIFIRRMCFYGHIITHNPSDAKFAEGWMNRLSSFVR